MNIDIKSVIIGIFFTSIVFLLLGITLLEKKIRTINTVNYELLQDLDTVIDKVYSISLAVEGAGAAWPSLHDRLDEILELKESIGNDENGIQDIHKKLDLIEEDLISLQMIILRKFWTWINKFFLDEFQSQSPEHMM